MANRDPDPQPEQNAPTKYGDQPFLGGDRKPLSAEILRFPQRPDIDPMQAGAPDAARQQEREVFAHASHDPSIDYQPPNPAMVAPKPNLTLILAGAVVAAIGFALIVFLMFHNFMAPGPKAPSLPAQQQRQMQQ